MLIQTSKARTPGRRTTVHHRPTARWVAASLTPGYLPGRSFVDRAYCTSPTRRDQSSGSPVVAYPGHWPPRGDLRTGRAISTSTEMSIAMHISIIGASAGIGLSTVTRALEAGHSVTTLSRTIHTIPTTGAVQAVAGSAVNHDDVVEAIAAADAILVTLGTGRSRKATTLYTDFARTLINVARKQAVRAPVIAVTGFGAGGSAAYQNPLMRTAMALLLANVYKNKTEMEQLLSTSALKWEIVRPGRLTNGTRSAHYRVLTDYNHTMKVSSISRDDVADYLVTEVEKPVNLGRYPALTK